MTKTDYNLKEINSLTKAVKKLEQALGNIEDVQCALTGTTEAWYTELSYVEKILKEEQTNLLKHLVKAYQKRDMDESLKEE